MRGEQPKSLLHSNSYAEFSFSPRKSMGGNATSPLHSRGSSKKGGQNQNWWGPQVGGNATSPLHSRGSPKKGGQNQNWVPNSCLLGGPQVGRNATSPLHSRGSPTKGTKSKQKITKKQKEKFSHGVPDPTYSPADCPHWGLNPGPSSCRGTALPTRVWPISDIPLRRGGIHIWSNLVFIHYWVLLKKLNILSTDTWGENPFFHLLLSQAKFP